MHCRKIRLFSLVYRLFPNCILCNKNTKENISLSYRHYVLFYLEVLYKKDNTKLSRLNFLIKCVEQIIEEHAIQQTQTSKLGQPTMSRTTKPTHLIKKYFPNFYQLPKVNPLRKPAICSKNGIRNVLWYWCSICKVLLCAIPYFEKYHNRKTN